MVDFRRPGHIWYVLNYQVQKISQSYEKLRAKKQQGDRQADVNLKNVCSYILFAHNKNNLVIIILLATTRPSR